MERCPALRETSRTMRLSLFKSGGIFRVSPKRKAALSRTLVLRELYTAPKEAELSGVISGGGHGGGEKRRTITFQKEMHGGQLEIKKLSLQLFHNSLDFRASNRGLCPSPKARNLPATFPPRSPLIFPRIRYNPPIEVQSTPQIPWKYICMYIRIYIRERGAITPSMISAGCLHRDTIPFYGFP